MNTKTTRKLVVATLARVSTPVVAAKSTMKTAALPSKRQTPTKVAPKQAATKSPAKTTNPAAQENVKATVDANKVLTRVKYLVGLATGRATKIVSVPDARADATSVVLLRSPRGTKAAEVVPNNSCIAKIRGKWYLLDAGTKTRRSFDPTIVAHIIEKLVRNMVAKGRLVKDTKSKSATPAVPKAPAATAKKRVVYLTSKAVSDLNGMSGRMKPLKEFVNKIDRFLEITIADNDYEDMENDVRKTFDAAKKELLLKGASEKALELINKLAEQNGRNITLAVK
jgi:hypothetical protein